MLSPVGKSNLLWGVVGGLSFLVLAQGYELVADLGVGMAVKIAVAVLVAAATAVAAHLARPRLPSGNESP